MAGPDNQRFETMLRRQLKSAVAPARADCPGPEVLAALWERSLSGAERALVDSHIGGCARCQSAMAAMARADSAAGGKPAPAHAPGFWLRVAAPASVLAVVLIVISMQAFKPRGQSTRHQIAMAIRHRFHRRDRQSAAPPALTPAPPPSETRRTELAKSQPAPPPQIAAAPSAAPSKPKEKPPEQIALASTAASPALGEMAMPRQANRDIARETAEKKEPSRAEPPASSPARQSAPAPPQAPAPERPAPALQSGTVSTAAPPPNAQPSGSAESVRAATQTGVASNQESAAKTAEQNLPHPSSAPGAASGATAGDVGGTQTPPSANAPALAASVQARAEGFRPGTASFQSPPPVVAWNIGPGGLIQKLGQGGWETEESGTSADLLSGSAPSAPVCWVAGRAGTLLRTTDGGAHWRRVPPPAPGDLAKVEARGADSATVTTSEGYRFATTDGGQNWTER